MSLQMQVEPGANINRNKELEAKSHKELKHRSGLIEEKFGLSFQMCL